MLGPRIREQRRRRGFNQQRLAHLLGITQVTLSYYERRERDQVPDGRMLDRLLMHLFDDPKEREVVRAYWEYYAMIDRAEVEYPGCVERFHKARLKIDA